MQTIAMKRYVNAERTSEVRMFHIRYVEQCLTKLKDKEWTARELELAKKASKLSDKPKQRRVKIRRANPCHPLLPDYPKHIIGGCIPLNVGFGMYCIKHGIQREAMAAQYPEVVFKWVVADLLERANND